MFCTDEVTVQYIMSHLDEDLESLAHLTPPPPIRPSLPHERIRHGRILEYKGNNTPEGSNNNNNECKDNESNKENEWISLPETSTLILQVMRVQDASQSLEQHLRSLTSTDKDHSNNNSKIKSLTEMDDVTSTRYGEIALQMSEEAEQEAWAREREKLHNKGSFINSNNNNNSNNNSNEASDSSCNNGGSTFTKGTSRYRHLRLELTDGFTRIIAVEDRHVLCNCEWHMTNKNNNKCYNLSLPLFPQGIALGAKIKLEWSVSQHNVPRVTCGVLRLNGKNTSVINNSSGVRQIQSYCETAARYLLQAMTGKPAKLEFSSSSNSSSCNNGNNNYNMLSNATEQSSENTEEQNSISTTTLANTSISGNVPVIQRPSETSSPSPSFPCATLTQPLEAWHAFCDANRHVAHATFRTRAVISGVLNDLEMREYYTNGNSGNALSNTSSANSKVMPDSVMEVHYSLLVSLSPPTLETSSSSTSTGISVHCDLGNTFLTTLIGMPASSFRQLHLSHNEHDRQRVQELIEHVSTTLEHFGIADFVLQPYHSRHLSDSHIDASSGANDNAEINYRAELVAVQPVSSR